MPGIFELCSGVRTNLVKNALIDSVTLTFDLSAPKP